MEPLPLGESDEGEAGQVKSDRDEKEYRVERTVDKNALTHVAKSIREDVVDKGDKNAGGAESRKPATLFPSDALERKPFKKGLHPPD